MSKRKADTIHAPEDGGEEKDESLSKRLAIEDVHTHAPGRGDNKAVMIDSHVPQTIGAGSQSAGPEAPPRGEYEGLQAPQAPPRGECAGPQASHYDDAVHSIFRFCGFIDYYAARRICKRWLAASQSPVWHGDFAVWIVYAIGLARLVPGLCNHVGSLDVEPRAGPALQLLHQFPRIHTLTCAIRADSFEEALCPTTFAWPPLLTSLTLTIFDTLDGPSDMGHGGVLALPDLQTCMVPRPRITQLKLVLGLRSALLHQAYGRPTVLGVLFPRLATFTLTTQDAFSHAYISLSDSFCRVLRGMQHLTCLHLARMAPPNALFDLTAEHRDAVFPRLTRLGFALPVNQLFACPEAHRLPLRLPGLEVLSLRHITRSAFAHVNGFARLVKLKLQSAYIHAPRERVIPGGEISDEDRRAQCLDARDLQALTHAPQLKTLRLTCVWMGSCKAAADTPRCACFHEEAQQNKATAEAVSRAGIAFLSSLRELETLEMHGCCLHDTLASLELPALQSMSITDVRRARRIIGGLIPMGGPAVIAVAQPPRERMPRLEHFVWRN